MSGKPIWESRFKGLANSLDSERHENDSTLASIAVKAGGKEINTVEYWKEVGKHELLEYLERLRQNWERADWF